MKFLTTLCMAATASALFRMLVPENKLSKQLAALVGAVFILTGISAISGADFSLDANSLSLQTEALNYRALSSANEELERQICAEMSDKIYAFLSAHEISPSKINISVNISGLYSINITQVELVFKSGEQAAAEAAAELLRGELPPEIEIGIEIITEVE